MTSPTENPQPKLKQDAYDVSTEKPADMIRFPPEEEASLVKESNSLKACANALFADSEFTQAIYIYEKALQSCPNYLDYEVAVIKSNIAACYLKLQDWKEAEKAATAAGERLERLRIPDKDKETAGARAEEADEEIISAGARLAEDTMATGCSAAEIERIQIKVLLRRARALTEMGGWAVLQRAMDDYHTLSRLPNLLPHDRQMVQRQLIILGPRTKAAQEKEMGDLMGQLKQLGNGILKPFGLSTDNFKMQKDAATGGYSMNFQPGSS